MLTTEMNLGKDSSTLPTAPYFAAQCSITGEDFSDANGIATGVYIFSYIALVLTAISATLGNLLVLVSIWRTPSLHSPSNVLLFGLAMSDLGVGLVVEPTAFVYITAKHNGLKRTFCNSAISINFFGSSLCFISLLTMTAISLDMYIALYLHLRYQEIVTVKRMTGVLVGIWLCSITASMFFIWNRERLSIVWMSLIVLCLLVTTSAYYKVYRIVRHHQGQIHAQAQVQEQAQDQEGNPTSTVQHRKSLGSKFLLYCLLVLCYLPIVVTTVVFNSTNSSVNHQSFFAISYLAVCFNSTLNPFVYCWRFQKIRTAVIETTKKMLRRTNSRQ